MKPNGFLWLILYQIGLALTRVYLIYYLSSTIEFPFCINNKSPKSFFIELLFCHLSKFLIFVYRPGPLELIKKNILHTEEPIERAVKEGVIAFRATCEG